MFDINLLRTDLAATAERDESTKLRAIDTAAFEALEADRKALQIQTQDLQQQHTLSKAVGQAKAAKDEAKAQALFAEVAALPEKVKGQRGRAGAIQDKVNALLMTILNIPSTSVPVGKDSDDNVEQRR